MERAASKELTVLISVAASAGAPWVHRAETACESEELKRARRCTLVAITNRASPSERASAKAAAKVSPLGKEAEGASAATPLEWISTPVSSRSTAAMARAALVAPGGRSTRGLTSCGARAAKAPREDLEVASAVGGTTPSCAHRSSVLNSRKTGALPMSKAVLAQMSAADIVSKAASFGKAPQSEAHVPPRACHKNARKATCGSSAAATHPEGSLALPESARS